MSADFNLMKPSLVMETSWEICNKVGGIYTVLSSRAASMVRAYGQENVLFVGPYLKTVRQEDYTPVSASPDKELSALAGLPVYPGRWEIPGKPNVALVDFTPLYEDKGGLYFEMWEKYGIRSELGYGDYDESCIFAIAAAKVMAAYRELQKKSHSVITVFNEWTTGMGLLWTKIHNPDVATVFITHATSVGRSISGNGKNLYAYMPGYNGDQMSRELGVEAKHTIEKLAAHHADAFGTVSEVTAKECAQLLEKAPDVVLENGFEPLLVPDLETRTAQRRTARDRILATVQTLYGTEVYEDSMIVLTGGRFEYRNKGLDLFVESLKKLAEDEGDLSRDIIALIAVPSWSLEPRHGLIYGLESKEHFTLPMNTPYLTHRIGDFETNLLTRRLKELSKLWGRDVFPLFVPSYLNGKDGILGLTYYETLPAADLTVFASYYEPWGYTPLESIAFGIPTITTDKAGFGEWASEKVGGEDIRDGVLVVKREDDNFEEAATIIKETISSYSRLSQKERKTAENKALELSRHADWDHFYTKYEQAFEIALKKIRK